jgi:PiT family inorganic phosphate transporter
MLYFLIAIALIFDFTNGANDGSSIVATVISSRAMRPRTVMTMAAIAEFIAPFLFGVAVANTVGKGLIDPKAISLTVVTASEIAALFWNLLTRSLGIPSSSSHALVGGLLGSAILAEGLKVVYLGGLLKILFALFITPPLGMVVGYIFMTITLRLFQNSGPRITLAFKRMQILTAISLALSHGSNDSQKTMGIITLALVASGHLSAFSVPFWVVAISAAGISSGVAVGGWRLIRTVGARIYKVRPVHAFTSQAASAVVVLGAALLGGPVSTSQIISSAVMGSGAAERVNKVRWQVGQEMVVTWVLTIPLTAIVSALFYLLLQQITIWIG